MIKYSVPFVSESNAICLLTIDIPTYSGDPINVYARENNAAVLYYDGGIDDVWDNPLVNINLTSVLLNEGQIDVEELQLIEDRTSVVTVTRDGIIIFKGYLIADQMQRQFVSAPNDVTISATSGLNLLEGMQYVGFGGELGTRCPLNFLRRILTHNSQLGINLPIRWSTSLEALDSNISGDPMQNLRWSSDGRGFYTYNPGKDEYTYKDARYILDGLVKAMQARIVQADGAWWVIGIKEHIKDVVDYYECANNTGLPVVTTHTRSSLKHIGTDYSFSNEDVVLTIKPALGKAVVTYDHDQRENILPNGGFDETSIGYIINWNTNNANLLALSGADITGQGGKSADLQNFGDAEYIFKLANPLPIDANVLYKKMNWGFTFMLLSGFPIDENGFIKWKQNEIKASVKYTIEESGVLVEYYLNEFGYWGNKNSPANAQVNSVAWSSSFGGSLIIQFDQTKNFYVGDEVVISFVRSGQIETYYITFDETMDVQTGTDYIASKITNGTTPNNWAVQINGVSNDPWNQAYTRKTNDYYKYIYFTVDNLKLNDSAAVTFKGAGALDVKTLDPGTLDETTLPGVGVLSVEFYIKPSQHLLLDDVWLSVNENNDVYSAEYTASKNTKEQNISLSISSAFSGFKVSNLMRNYHTSNVDYLFTDGADVGSITELYARAVMKSKYKPCTVFNGTIYTNGNAWSYLDNYTIATLGERKFIPVNPSFNVEREEVNLIAIEERNDAISLDIKHYGNDYNLET